MTIDQRRRYLVLAVDKIQPYSDCEECLVYFQLFNLSNQKPEVPEKSALSVTTCDLKDVPERLCGLLDNFKKSGKRIDNVRIFPGHNFSSGLAIAQSLYDSGLFTKRAEDKGTKTLWAYTTVDTITVKTAVVKEVPYSFPLAYEDKNGNVVPTSDRFNQVVNHVVDLVGIEDFCKKTITALRLVRDKIRGEFNDEESCSPSVAGDLALMDQDLHMNAGGRQLAEHKGELIHYKSFDLNSAYTFTLLVNKFSKTNRVRKMSKAVPEFRQWKDKFSYENRFKFIEVLKEFCSTQKYKMRLVLHVHDVMLKDGGTPLHINFSPRLCSKDMTYLQDTGLRFIKGSCDIALFLEEAELFINNYIIPDDCDVDEVYFSEMVKLPAKIRQKILDSFVDVMKCRYDRYEAIAHQKNCDKGTFAYDHWGKQIVGLHADESFMKLVKNNWPGYFQYSYSQIKTWAKEHMYDSSANFNPAMTCKLGHKAQKQGYLYNPLVGAEVTMYGRMLHRRFEKFFTDRGFKVFYGNTDSIYVEEAEGLDDALKQWNLMISKEFNAEIRDLKKIDMKIRYWDLPGTAKEEGSGVCIHNGINKMIAYDPKKGQFDITWSGVIGADILRHIQENKLKINDIKPGYVFPAVGQVDPLTQEVVVKPLTF